MLKLDDGLKYDNIIPTISTNGVKYLMNNTYRIKKK